MQHRIIFGIAALVILLKLSAVEVAAQTPTNTNPGAMKIFDNRPHAIPGNTALWYVFYYNGDKSPFQIKMAGATNTGLGFRLYTPNQVERLRSGDKPLGQGSANTVSCSTGRCQSSDLTWDGGTSTESLYIIEVTNNAPVSQVFNMTITGSGVQIGPALADALGMSPLPTAPSLPSLGPTPALMPPVVPPQFLTIPRVIPSWCSPRDLRYETDPYC